MWTIQLILILVLKWGLHNFAVLIALHYILLMNIHVGLASSTSTICHNGTQRTPTFNYTKPLNQYSMLLFERRHVSFLFAGRPVKQRLCHGQMEPVGGKDSCQRANSKPHVCLVWIRDEHNMDHSGKVQKKKQKCSLFKPYISLDGINEMVTQMVTFTVLEFN